jgi:hypothetical protein
MKPRLLPWLSLFTSGSTLICCALPALLVTLGAGAVLSSTIAVFPQLVWLSEHKLMVFLIAGCMLFIAGYWQWQARSLPCPADAQLAKACQNARRFSLVAYLISVLIFCIGIFFAFIAPLFL